MFTAYIDGALSPGEYDTVARHVAGCPSCQALLAELEETTFVLVDLVESTTAPMDIEQRVMAEIQALNQTRQANRLSLVPAIAGILGFAIIAAILLSPAGMIIRVTFRLLYRASGGIATVPVLLGHWWVIVFAISALMLIWFSVAAVLRLLRSVQSEVLL